MLAEVAGTWQPAVVAGRLLEQGWGATLGYPAIVLDEHGPGVHGFMLESDRLGEHWARLDDFEGDGYDRVVTTADLDDGGRVEAYIYVLRGLSSAAEVARS